MPGEGQVEADPSPSTLPFKGAAPEAPADPSLPVVPGHVILGVLGRGGMGVVYKAQHVSLKRFVALKMILSGPQAQSDELARFRHEAEAVARLQHPNIVQIYEVGESDGRPFFSLEFIAGGSLAQKLAQRPQPPALAASLVETLARAMHYTHQRGIIHRDLKPANILIAAQDAPLAPEHLKITDFGLAKQVEDQGQTRSGAILGTPSYMAPEQAAGASKHISPLTDVYALGAILYQMLTGRPPFAGETTLETLQQVLFNDPTPPARLQSGIPRDLETICLKALSKRPEQRYASAQAMADDLARFQAGEPILGRRTSLLVRLSRHLQRRPLMFTSLGVLVGALMLAGYFLVRGLEVDRADALLKTIDQGLETSAWSPAHVQALETSLQELHALDADKAALARGRVYRRFGDALRLAFASAHKPVLSAEDIQNISKDIEFLATRDADLARAIDQELGARLRKSQVVEIAHPFTNRDVLVPGHFEVKDKALVATGLHLSKEPWLAPVQIPCQGTVAMTVVFEPNTWQNAGSLTLALNAQRDLGYFFKVIPIAAFSNNYLDQSPPPSTFTKAKEASGVVRVRIVRNGAVLRDHDIPAAKLADGPLTVTVTRDAYRLSMQLNQEAPVVYFDGFPLASPGPGTFAIGCPAGTGISKIRVANQALPALPTPLERGDMLYTESKFAEALAFYEQQEVAPGATVAGQELRYKRGACLVALNRPDEAIPWLEEVAAAEGPRWPLLAGCQLWLIHFRQKKLNEADAVFLRLSNRYPPETLATVVPEEVRYHLFYAYTVDGQQAEFVRFDPNRVARLERIAALADVVMVQDRRRLQIGLALIRAHHFTGQYPQATEAAAKMLQDPLLTFTDNVDVGSLDYRMRVIEEYGWLLRLQGRAAEGLSEIERRLFNDRGVPYELYWPLWLERARLHLAQNQPEQAEKDLTSFLAGKGLYKLDYRYYAEASLLLGFLRKRQGDAAGAKAIWEKGVYPYWLEKARKAHPEVTFEPLAIEGTSFLTHLLLGSLTNQLQPADTQGVVKMVIKRAVGQVTVGALQDLFQLPPALLCQAWQSPAGLATAEKMACKNIPWPDYFKAYPVVIGYTLLRENALPRQVSPEQDQFAWDLMEDLWRRHHTTDTLSRDMMLSLALTWKGTTNFLGWSGVAPKLEPSFRGPIAYIMGHRYLRLNYPDSARDFFQTALKNAPPNSTLARLAQAEIERLGKKK